MHIGVVNRKVQTVYFFSLVTYVALEQLKMHGPIFQN